MSDPTAAPINNKRAVDLAIRLAVVGLIVAWCFAIVRPFVEIALWAVVLAVALHQPTVWLAERLGLRFQIAAVLMTAIVLAVVLGPVSVLATRLVANLQDLVPRLLDGSLHVPPPPPGVTDWPVIGPRLATAWQLASTNLVEALAKLGPQLEPLGVRAFDMAAGAAVAFAQILAATILAGFILAFADPLVAAARGFARRLVPDRGPAFVSLVGATTRGVASGVVGVGILQALLAGLGFVAAGIPFAGILTFLVLVMAIVQIGPTLVIGGAVVYAFWALDPLTALLFTAWMIPVSIFDNILRPILMARGLKVPMLVILLGVIGGLVAHGLIGLFIGPVVLAVGYELLIAWIADDPGLPVDGGSGHHAPSVPKGDTP
ncbi:MAG: AI-2E family transporter [Pseudomonadota bacterium]